MTTPEQSPWLRREDETSRQYELFRIYLNMGSERSQVKVAREVGKSETYVCNIATQKEWIQRVREFDNYLAQAHMDGATEWITNARSETQALADKLRGLLSTRLDQCIASNQDPTMRWSTAAGVLLKMQEAGIAPVESAKMAAELDRVANMLEKITGEAVQ